jgi:hypothetical protein
MSKRFVEGNDESIGKGSHANMPQDVYMKSYPKSRLGGAVDIDDGMTDIDDVADANASQRNRNVSYQK